MAYGISGMTGQYSLGEDRAIWPRGLRGNLTQGMMG
jgi:hypothetical protein